MISWINLSPVFLLPFLVVFAPAFFPYTEIFNGFVDGEAWRVWFLDHFVLPVLSDSSAWFFVSWYKTSSLLQHYFLHFLISLNITVLSWPVLFVFGSIFIKSSNFLVLKSIEQKRRTVR